MTNTRQKSLVQPFDFYREYYLGFLIILIVLIIMMLSLAGIVLYQIKHRPLPEFIAVSADNKQVVLTSRDDPNFLPSTIIKWASKAAVTAYTFDFANYNKQLEVAKPYFTSAGWDSFRGSIIGLLDSITANQLFVNGVVVGAPVITNEGYFTGHGYAWRVQLPFLVTIQSAEVTVPKNYTLILTIVKVPTQINPTGIGIDQFVMR